MGDGENALRMQNIKGFMNLERLWFYISVYRRLNVKERVLISNSIRVCSTFNVFVYKYRMEPIRNRRKYRQRYTARLN